ncbi:MAG: glycoside hydrolase family 2, partial [Clostridia bacterium]|nr:glycoside hydrolase family 2 [Clostridia bacterium]
LGRSMGKDPVLYYTRTFTVPADFIKDRVLLHFGAVDQTARVLLNDMELGTHTGGYDAFTFDITDALQDSNTLEVYVTDTLSDAVLPYGKQCYNRGGMWYTPVTGIWQTVWLESVPETYVRRLSVHTTLDAVRITAEGITEGEICIKTPEGEICARLTGSKAEISIPSPRHWTPEEPYLYRFTLRSGADTVHSYFALRTVDVRQINGILRICLNGKPYFLHALLDQGYYSDGIFTPASPASYTEDILAIKKLGFNTLRKHIKIEPECFYYDCDRLGMIVMQDMVSNGKYSFLRDTALPTIGLKKRPDRWMHTDPAARKAFAEGVKSTVRQLHNHPCICYWTIFNEGWGQFDGTVQYRFLHDMDDTRIIDTASGWFGGCLSDVESIHVYFRPVKIRKKTDSPLVLSEFGGYACKIPEHSFDPDKTYGYRYFTDPSAFADALIRLYEDEIIPAVEKGLCGAVYTQVSDVEDETNGLFTYDRKICKADAQRMSVIAQKLCAAMQASCEEDRPPEPAGSH